MKKRFFLIAAVVAVIFYFGATALWKQFGPKSHLDMDFDIADAIELFDKTCMERTVYKLQPDDINGAFVEMGLTDIRGASHKMPGWPVSGISLIRPDNGGSECIISFTSFEDIETVIHPKFVTFTDTRLSRPMTENQNAFQFEYPPLPAGVQSNRPERPDPADIRSFADTDMQYFVILRPSSYDLSHKLHLIVLPLSALE
ncbi:hypothetical protein [Parasulfitobacter algicola]|uniref:Uncharacterized protein n=1 Tax=Parasulfitobacter algicola TaxID=2614809 RepID=A0ABX2IRF3_9RHOB|nr:hypothetical protein [Sulfitobacter algicola]NSX54596.1 hypothetical protein [Sulfitobacter algicola]